MMLIPQYQNAIDGNRRNKLTEATNTANSNGNSEDAIMTNLVCQYRTITEKLAAIDAKATVIGNKTAIHRLRELA